jgi:HrpA-like RNA helicase
MISPSLSQKPKFVLTDLGEVLSHIPLEPLHAKIILEARKSSCLLKGIILIAVLVFEEIFDIDRFKNNLQEWQLKVLQKSTGLRSLLLEQFKEFINPVSDLLTRVNMIYFLLANIIVGYGSFKNEEISEKSLFYLVDHISQYLLWQDSFINKQVDSFVDSYSMNKKLVIEMVKFCLQIIKLMISIETDDVKKTELLKEVQTYTKTSKKEQKILSELLIKNMNHKILLKKEMIIGEKKVYKIYDEDQNEVKIINSCLISRNTSFYIYSMKLQVNNGFIVSGLTKINDVSLLLKHSPQYTQIQIDQKSFSNLSKSESLLKVNSIFGKSRWTANGLILSLPDIKIILNKNSKRISQMNSLKKFSKQMEGILIKEIENDFSCKDEFDSEKELENAQKVLSAVSCKMMLNGSYYPRVKVLDNKFVFDASKLSMDQMFSHKGILPLLLHIKKHRLFTQRLMDSEQGVNSARCKALILNLLQPKWQTKCSSMYHKIFKN